MDIKEKSSKDLTKEFEIKIKKEEIDKLVSDKLVKFSSQAQMPGFRPGKVPISVLKARFGKQVLGEVINESMNEASKKIIEENKINAVSQPKMEITSFDEGKDLDAKLSVEIMPHFKVPDLTALKIIRPIAEVSKADIDQAINRIAKENSKTEIITENRSAKNDDTLVIDFEGKIDGKVFEGGASKGYHLKLGSNSFIPGFEEKLIGVKKGDTKVIDLVFPKNYQAKNLANKQVQFDVKVNEIRKDVETNIDDDFAKSLGIESLETLKKNVSSQISSQHQFASRSKAKRQILDKLADSVDFKLPKSIEHDEYLNVCKAMNINLKNSPNEASDNEKEPDFGMKPNEKKDAKAIAARRVRLGLVLSEIGRQNNIQVQEEDKKNAMMSEVQKYPGREKEILDYFKNNPEAQNQLSGPIFEDKIIDFILELANIEDKKVSIDELYKEDEFDLEKEAKKAKKLSSKNNVKNDKKNKSNTKK
tara:strand:+ start:590 stop:2017 length:1428 start_codon:yes stop_codon:yes gene_type:complete